MRLTPDLLIRAYTMGVFPMAESADDDEIFWFDPPERGILPLDGFHAPRRLMRTVRQGRFQVTVDTDFAGVMRACGESTTDRPDTWINAQILEAYVALHRQGHAHSVECRREGRLVGGLYGVSIGGAFFGESMFSRETDASKVALVHLVARLRAGGYRLLDTQFVTTHLAQFGAVEIPRARYRALLAGALSQPGRFHCQLPEGSLDDGALVAGFLQSTTQTS
ncbi:leucyl/phenylalanyl-tRNA--protein transferase [Nitrospirillum sp. BR 11828]|uniref:leucyl/phenylalanyl-tRNA--protein transferase n=1 Tax=Nitrospirillum sp. BR 11828 TaxID=3104325 RepID=UPI002ACAE305|nr:leucyl/phenylalanyl-tRNA--protein transferase [Nitrospirillum sp. BR 11828]MDZ5649318.1 leucyl/phenylalanyl-tRNA--protein transferase [Nitrospirillum sp. BR 11828]